MVSCGQHKNHWMPGIPLLKLDMCYGSGICGDGNEEIIAEHSFSAVIRCSKLVVAGPWFESQL
jgi:hypothetical protein